MVACAKDGVASACRILDVQSSSEVVLTMLAGLASFRVLTRVNFTHVLLLGM